MTVNNLGVCFGPTLLRPEEETVASIMDLKFYNIVVDILIENYEKIFNSEPETIMLPDTCISKSSAYLNNKSSSNDGIINKKSSDYFTQSEHSSPISGVINDSTDQYIKHNNHIAAVKPIVYNQPLTCVRKSF